METFATIAVTVTAIVTFMASIHTKHIFERHLFAWVSGAYAIRFGLLISGFMDQYSQQYLFDSLSGTILVIFGVLSLLRSWNPKINSVFTPSGRRGYSAN